MKILRFIISFASALALSCLTAAQAQNLRDSVQVVADSVVTALPKAAVADADTSAAPAAVDSIGLAAIDPGLSEFVPDPIDSLPVVKSTLERPAFSSARDSVIEDMRDGRNIIYYYGDVTVTYGDIAITSDYMAYDIDNNIVFARGTKDYNGEWVGQPKMTNKGNEYTMEEVYYNFNSKKAKIKNMITNQKEGELRGENLKMLPDESINIAGGVYTVCDAEHPHYYMKMTAAKITGNSKRTVFGPAYVVVEDVPLPIVLPFGFVPEMPERASGILVPTFGEETARGIYMRDLGYYFVIGDHFDVSLTGDVYTYGSWAAKMTTRYKKRYAFDGSLSVNYSVDITGERDAADYRESRNFGLNWSHSQDSKARPGTSFRASVNFSSPKNNTYNSTSIAEAVQNQTSSSISYAKTFSFGSVSINALHSQNSRDSSYSITFPNITFNVNRFYPFKRKVRVGKERIYEQISLSYNTTLQNKIAFKASELKDPGLINKMENGMTHNFAIGLPQFTLLKYFNFSPSISYGMNWYFRE
ncbi:MAG: LPS-assembly protein LptD, partial [Bacteroidales bacterium]|nr:LPS-assembly protein LptD [Bacteroidales bacterium]